MEHAEENADRVYNKMYHEKMLADNLFDHFLDATNSRPLFQKLEKLAEDFLVKLYPRPDLCCRDKMKFTFDVSDVSITGFHGFSKQFGVSRTVYQEVTMKVCI